MNQDKFDRDLKYGQEGEHWLTFLGSVSAKMEIKQDRKWVGTGNLFFEYECNGKKSGLAITEADYFCYILDNEGVREACFIWKTHSLKKALRSMIKDGLANHKEMCGDGGRVKGYVLAISRLGELTHRITE